MLRKTVSERYLRELGTLVCVENSTTNPEKWRRDKSVRVKSARRQSQTVPKSVTVLTVESLLVHRQALVQHLAVQSPELRLDQVAFARVTWQVAELRRYLVSTVWEDNNLNGLCMGNLRSGRLMQLTERLMIMHLDNRAATAWDEDSRTPIQSLRDILVCSWFFKLVFHLLEHLTDLVLVAHSRWKGPLLERPGSAILRGDVELEANLVEMVHAVARVEESSVHVWQE